MHIKIKSAPGGFEQTGEYERVHITDFLTDFVSDDSDQLDDDTLLALHRYLNSGRAPEGALDLSGLDGLMTAVLASRDGVGVDRWTPVIWGGAEPVFEAMAEAKCIFAAISRRFRQIEADLGLDDRPVLILKRSPEDDILAGAWCRGFLQGISLVLEQWTPALWNEEGQKILFPISIVAGEESLYRPICSRGGDAPWDLSNDLVFTRWHPFAVQGIPSFWANWRARQAQKRDGTLERMRHSRPPAWFKAAD